MVNLTLTVINKKVTEAHQHFEEETRFLECQKKHVKIWFKITWELVILHKGLTFEEEHKNHENSENLEEQDTI